MQEHHKEFCVDLESITNEKPGIQDIKLLLDSVSNHTVDK